MAIEVVCGECGAGYDVPERLAGKTIKCKACAGPIPVPGPKAAVARPAAKPAATSDERPAAPAARPARFADDDAPATPRPAAATATKAGRGNDLPLAKNKSAAPWVLLGLFGVTVLTATAGAGLLFSGLLDDKPVAVANPAPWSVPPAIQEGPRPGGPGPARNPAPEEVVPPEAQDPAAPKPRVGGGTTKRKPPVPVDDSPWITPAAGAAGTAATTPPPPGGSVTEEGPRPAIVVTPLVPPKSAPAAPGQAAGPRTSVDPLAIERAKNAAVYMEVESNGGTASGTGWFGVEQNLIFTNAHVVDMLAPNAPKPRKMTVWVNPGSNKERVIAHSKLEILAVDRFADLCVIRVLNEENLPTPLKIRPSAELRDIEPLVVIGYPGGRKVSAMTGSNKAPQATVNQTFFSTNRLDNDGNINFVQTRGGAYRGNSGGPIVDFDGNVCAVVVSGPTDPNLAAIINYGVPTEMVAGLLAGRVADVEYGQAYRKDGKVRLPVKVNVLDPFQRMKEVGIGAWVGDPSDKNRSPGAERAAAEPSDGALAETKLTYKWTKDKQVATGEIEYPELQAGRAYWSQPYYKNAITPSYWMAGRAVKMNGPPVDLEAADLVLRLKIGSRRPTTLVSSGHTEEYEENERTQRDEQELFQTEIKATETVEKTSDPSAVAQLRLNYETLNWKAANIKGEREDILGQILPKNVRQALSQNIKLVQGFGFIRKDGQVYKTLSDLRGTPEFATIFREFSANAMQALEGASVPLPNTKVEPNYTWKVDHNVRLQIGFTIEPADKKKDGPADGPGTSRPAPAMRVKEYKYIEEITYKYLGTRTRLGQKEAVVRVEGVIKPAAGTSAQQGATGSVKGYAYLDLETGTVLESELKKEFEMDTSADGVKKVVAGVSNYKITRGTAQ